MMLAESNRRRPNRHNLPGKISWYTSALAHLLTLLLLECDNVGDRAVAGRQAFGRYPFCVSGQIVAAIAKENDHFRLVRIQVFQIRP